MKRHSLNNDVLNSFIDKHRDMFDNFLIEKFQNNAELMEEFILKHSLLYDDYEFNWLQDFKEQW